MAEGAALVSHMIPCAKSDQEILSVLADRFRRKGRAVEVALEWAISKEVPNDPQFPSFPQVHVSLTKDYRAKYEPSHLGAMLHSALISYWNHTNKRQAFRPGVWYWSVDLPSQIINTIESDAFTTGRNPENDFAEILTTVLHKVRDELPPGSVGSVDIAFDPAMKKLFKDVQAECDRRNMDIDTLLVPAFVTEMRRRQR
jgi:hypothetical protein